MESEILSDAELAEITGYKARAWQRRWLDNHHWVYVESRGKRPLVGRQYARMKLGVSSEPIGKSHAAATPAWTPDFSRINQ
ncbi:DUF4224 domain-containing protein [Pseudomonas aeruginosa]|uniref:DUF4224 domain-containing protein n=1 Tax=Pseudomonas aeruginosa TaxID=287 RepID=UPI001067983E|nr:DUF4224 domain-containing protein [Pseudomonas aeruginosa]TEP56562.1 DUF4224 domain-containing protein [Pseudomonas aeruginosa]TEP75289.1 DUF4224 domain-containing protein [Pseudomonas aeruginosa]